MKDSQTSKRVAFCGVLGALAVVMLALGGIVPFATFSCPVIAMFLLLPVIAEFGCGTALVFYVAVALLGVLLSPDKEVACFFVFLGYYPVLKQKLDRISSKVLRAAAKFVVFNVAITAMYVLLLFVFRMDALTQEFAEASRILLIGLYLLGNAAFFICDLALQRIMYLYLCRYRKKLFHN